jgi:hypothetical protein
MPTTKAHITKLIEAYILENPSDWEIFKNGVAMTRKFTKDEFATLYGSNDTRALFEMPEKLYNDLIIGLSEDEMQWFKTKKGSLWFVRTFPAFALPASI